jgi:Tol biopolymer transport system component
MDVIRPIFSPNGDRLAYYRQKGDRWVVVTDGKESRPYDAILPAGPVFSPDGRHVAYAAWLREKGMCLVLDGVEQKWFEGIARDHPPVFSLDGRHVAYVALRGEYMAVVRDGEKGKEYRWVGQPVFSSDSKRLCYAALVGGLVTDQYAVIVDGQRKGANRGQVRSPVFSPDGERLAWIAMRSVVGLVPLGGIDTGTVESVVIDGKKGKEYAKIQALTFCPQGRRVAYIAFRGTERFVVVDGQEQEKFTAVGNGPLFSPDGKHVAYSAGDAQGRGFLVVDDAKYPIDCLRIVFTSPTTLRVLGATDKRRRFVRLDVQLPEQEDRTDREGDRR